MKKTLLLAVFLPFVFLSCSDDNTTTATTTPQSLIYNESVKEKAFQKFTLAFSKIIYDNKSVRNFIKEEALKQFDNDYDVLYLLIKDKVVDGNKSFRDYLLTELTVEELKEIEFNIPLLNILLPNISSLNLIPEMLNIEDKEIPVAYSRFNGKEEIIDIYFNGEKEGSIDNNVIPAFNLFVVNENQRITLNTPSKEGMSYAIKSTNSNELFTFKDPSFNGMDNEKSTFSFNYSANTTKRTNYVNKTPVLLEAFQYFNKNDNSINQIAFQRDYLYYGLTPTKQQGALNYSRTEYLRSLTLNPRILSTLEKGTNNLINPDITQNKRTLSPQEIINRMWSGGAYRLSFEVISNDKSLEKFYISARPDELFDLTEAFTHTRRNGSFWRKSRNWYKFDINKVKAKEFFPEHYNLNGSLGSWNAREALTKDLIIELDVVFKEVLKQDYVYTTQKSATSKFNGDIKFGVGTETSGGISAGVDHTNSTTKSTTISRTTNITNIQLATLTIGYYKPILNSNGQFYQYEKGDVKLTLNTL
jgi:hypothetical protein